MSVLSATGFLLLKIPSTHTAGIHPDTSGARGAVASLFQGRLKMRISEILADIMFACDVRCRETSRPVTSLRAT